MEHGCVADKEKFARITSRIEDLLTQNRWDQIATVVADGVEQDSSDPRQWLLEGIRRHLHQEYRESVDAFLKAGESLSPEDLVGLNSVYTKIFIDAQLHLSRWDRPAYQAGYHLYKSNIKALAEVDPDLAKEVQRCDWPAHIDLVSLWQELGIVLDKKHSLSLQASVVEQLGELKTSAMTMVFEGLSAIYELYYCLEHPYDGLHGMARGHYFVVENPQEIKLAFYWRDFTRYLRDRNVIIFGGSNARGRMVEIFSTLRYMAPQMIIGGQGELPQVIEEIFKGSINTSARDEVLRYYQSDEFAVRQKDIARGKIMPRVMVETCRWTTFLKFCAADFEKAFSRLGCETFYFIEHNDVERKLEALYFRTLQEFRPDVIFIVSHSRPSLKTIPPQLPVIGYIQDKCGPILTLPQLSGHIMPHDLFVCMATEFQWYLGEKGVPKDQMFIMPVPADETIFCPLPVDHPQAEVFRTEVAFVKHGGPTYEKAFASFLEGNLATINPLSLRQSLTHVFTDLYKNTCLDTRQCRSEADMQKFVAGCLTKTASEDLRQYLCQLVNAFYVSVYSLAWRCRFLEDMDQAGIPPRLYGNHWSSHDRLKHLDHGPVDRTTKLNLVYNFSRINLSINHAVTMHQRLSECGLAGGFVMVANLSSHVDREPVTNYFEPDRDIVLFENPRDLTEKCRYYLTHPQERQDIAARLHQRALRDHTCAAGATKILDRWRQVLAESMK